MLPLSGQYAAWGHKALDAILLQARIFDKENKTSWEVIAEDSGGLPEKTKAAIAHLANDKNVMAIIAVTETAEAVEAASEAQKLESAYNFNNVQRRSNICRRIRLPAFPDTHTANQGFSTIRL